MEWLVILAVVLICPLMHFWMMRKGGLGHGNHKKKRTGREGGEEKCPIVVGQRKNLSKKK